MASIEFTTTAKRGTTTSRVKKKTGEVRVSVSIGAFPRDLWQFIKDLSSPHLTLTNIFSDAISELRADFDSGAQFLVQGPSGDGKDVKLWILEKSNHDLRYLSYRLQCFHRQVVHTAILRWIKTQHLQDKWDARMNYIREKRQRGGAP